MTPPSIKRLNITLRCPVNGWGFRFYMEVPLNVFAQVGGVLVLRGTNGLTDVHAQVRRFDVGTDGVVDVDLLTASFAGPGNCLTWLWSNPAVSNQRPL